MKYLLSILLLIIISTNCYLQNEIDMVYDFIKKQGKNPIKYVISKFKEYDYVFIGEYHRQKHDVDFVTSLIPILYKNGIKNITYEFYECAIQTKIDSLLTAKECNEKELYHTISKGYGVNWGYSEYVNLFKKVWEFNLTLKENQPKFRLVLLHYEYLPCEKGLKKLGGVDPDKFMAEVFEKEIISKGEKALIYCGIHHAFTKYKQPLYDFKENKLYGFNDKRFGNIIYSKYPDKTFTIFMHAPWMSILGINEQPVKPVNGIIDSVMKLMQFKPVGFDLKNNIIGLLKSTDSYYSIGYKDFKLSDFCD